MALLFFLLLDEVTGRVNLVPVCVYICISACAPPALHMPLLICGIFQVYNTSVCKYSTHAVVFVFML